ncbi:MAG: Na/Pi cotransporter family protein, partial [Lentisphaerae bacterium]|nr:Na/Pi cotransporter family protein [Lentisphaerota bacterium]
AHLLFNLISVVITMLLYRFYLALVPMTANSLPHQIANAHFIIKTVNVLLILPFVHPFGRLVIRILPGNDPLSAAPEFLSPQDAEEPEKALANVQREISRMCGTGMSMIHDAVESLLTKDEITQERILKQEKIIDNLYNMVAAYLLDAFSGAAPTSLSGRPALLLNVMNNVERIGDHAENIVELSQVYGSKCGRFGEDATNDILAVLRVTEQIGNLAVTLLDKTKHTCTDRLPTLTNDFNNAKREALRRHTDRLRNGHCTVVAGIVFTILIVNLESVVDHLQTVATTIADTEKE